MAYYIETNLIAIIVGVLLLYFGEKISSKEETTHIIMKIMLQMMIMLSICDIVAYAFRGKNYYAVHAANMMYFILLALGAYAWFLYVLLKMNNFGNLKKKLIITGIPISLLCVSILINPVTNFYFYVDSNNFYHRGPGLFVTWIIEWGYVIAATAINVRAAAMEKSIYRRREICGYLVFAIPLAVAAVTQMLFYGTTSTQIGYMIALLMVYMNKQQYQAQRDELTDLNNKNSLLRYLDSILGRESVFNLTIFMVDADRFKFINDTYGHLKGDKALKDIAKVLKMSADAFSQARIMLFRYGGDEFVIIGKDMTDEQIRMIQEKTYMCLEEVNTLNRQNDEKYTISLSIGYASGECADLTDFNDLMRRADENMYKIKQSKRNSRD